MVMIYFQDHHLLFTMRTDQRIIAKRRKDRSTPPVKTTESMPFFFRNSEMEFFINGTMSGIKAAITDHLEMFFRDVPDKAFDKIHDRNGFLNVLIIFVTIVMERDKITGIRIDPGSGNDRATKIPANIFGNSLRVTTVGFGINIEAVFMFQITTGRNFFKRRTDAEQHFLEESSTESIAKESIVEMRDITPESIITVTAFRDETMDMRIPFKIPAESMQDHDKTRGKVFVFVHFRENLQIHNIYHGVRKTVTKNGQHLYTVRIHIHGNYLVGRYATDVEAAIAYNKAIDILRNKGVTNNFLSNYVEGIAPSRYAEIYSSLPIAPGILNYPAISPNNR